MTKKDKLIKKLFESKTISFDEADKILTDAGFLPERPASGSSHITYRKQGKNPVTLIRNRKELKPYQIKMLQETLQ